jgi:hypothetical protein
MAIWTALQKFEDTSRTFQENGWGIVAVGALTLLIEIAVASLLAFHFYISCVENMTTYEHNYEPRKSSEPNPNDIIYKINMNLW